MTGLPEGWRSASIGEVASVDSGPAFQSKLFGGPHEGTRLLRGDNIEPGALRWQRTRTWPDERLSGFESLLVEVGDIILAMDRPVITSGLKLGRVTPNDLPALLVQRVARIRATGAESGYLYHLLESRQFVHHLQGKQVGTQIPHITLKTIRDFPVPLPPANEQRRIVNILEDHFSRLDAAHSSLASALLRLRVLHKSVLMDLIPDVSAYPAHWSRSTVSDAGKVTLGRQRHPDWHKGANMHPYLRVANVFEDRLDLRDVKEMHWPDDSFERFRLKPGDVLLNEGQSPEFLGRPAMYRGEPIDIAFTNTLIRFQANDYVLPEFALLVFRRHMHAGRFASESRITTNIAHLSASRLKPIEFPIPPVDEQKRLAGLAEQQLGDAARLGDQVGLLEVRNRVLRRALLGAAFAGRLTGRTTDMEIVEEMAGV